MMPLLHSDVATFVNVFTIEPSKQNTLTHRIKSDAETTISRQAGFIKAIVHSSLDGSRVVNVVQWESTEASRAIHRNPDIAAKFASYQELDVQMDLRYYEAALTTGRHFTVQNHNSLMAQIDVLHVAPDNQQRLLEQLTQYSTSIAFQEDSHSIIWLRSLDGIRVMRFLYLHKDNDYESTLLSFNQVPEIKHWVKQIDTNRYQVECVVAKPCLLI